MSFDVLWTRRGKDSISVLGEGVLQSIQDKIDELETHPKKRGDYKSDYDVYSLRIGTPGGEYRALYDVYEDKEDVVIQLVASRESVYDLLDRMD